MLADSQIDDAENRPSSTLSQFLASMVVDYEKWHDGIGYDLSLIDKMTPNERNAATKVLLGRNPPTWRDLEALKFINTDEAKRAITAALKHPSMEVRVAAARFAENSDEECEAVLTSVLEQADLYNGLTQALDQIERFHPPRIVEALFRCALMREGEVAVHCAAMLFFVYGKATSAFDWNHRPFYLRFHTSNRSERISVFKELCQKIGVDSTKYLQDKDTR